VIDRRRTASPAFADGQASNRRDKPGAAQVYKVGLQRSSIMKPSRRLGAYLEML